ncbi:MAG: benzoate-CoA ligase family protein [Actinomycetota bacterium]|nr:benzoate-CoA ligase family protein [Actinomycetota bacterium]
MADELFNACGYLLDRRVAAGDGDRLAVTGISGELTYNALLERVQRTATVLSELGLQAEHRLLMCVADSPEFVNLYLAAMRIGAVAVPVSTMQGADGLHELLLDSRARLLAVGPEFIQLARDAVAGAPDLRGLIAAGGADIGPAPVAVHDLDVLATEAAPRHEIYPTTADSPAFWLYTSGTTGTSKAAMHRHGSVRVVCETYATQVLGISRDDRCLSAAKAFFAYGLGNSVLFPLSVGACAVLEPAPAKPALIAERAARYGATLFFGGPTFFANMLRAGLPPDALHGVRLATSAGEALPAELYRRWTSQFGIDIIDGIGMTEMLHIFLSNRPGSVRPGTTGVAVPGYDLRVVDEAGVDVATGTPGTLLVRGDSAAMGYWARYSASRQVFQGEWLRTGDTYMQDGDGYYACLGRTGDMLKSSGIWVSPAEVEERLLSHPSVAQAVVVAAPDADGLERPVAYVLLQAAATATDEELIEHCRPLESFKRPRKIVFVGGYPTTATGKVRRVELRAMAASVLVEPASAPQEIG